MILLYIPQYFTEFILIGTTVVERGTSISDLLDHPYSNPAQFQEKGLNLQFLEMLQKHQPFEPIEQVIRQHTNHHAACVQNMAGLIIQEEFKTIILYALQTHILILPCIDLSSHLLQLF